MPSVIFHCKDPFLPYTLWMFGAKEGAEKSLKGGDGCKSYLCPLALGQEKECPVFQGKQYLKCRKRTLAPADHSLRQLPKGMNGINTVSYDGLDPELTHTHTVYIK